MRSGLTVKFLTIVTFLGICTWDCAAQQTGGADSSPAAPSSAGSVNDAGTNNSKPQTETDGTSKDRLFFALPNFLTLENAANVPPLTAAEKFKVVTRSAFDYAQFLWYGALAGIGQARDNEAGYGQGAEGYAKRYGSAFGDGTIENFSTRAIFPSLLHQDPRYFQLGKGSFWHRTAYAVSRIFVTRSDSGHNQFNFSEIGGDAFAAGISTFTYHPREDRNLGSALSVWGTQAGYDALGYLAKEFWPDLRRRLRKSRSR